jgi:hypothetical protein
LNFKYYGKQTNGRLTTPAHHAAPVPKNMERNAMDRGCNSDWLEPQHDLPSDRIPSFQLRRNGRRAIAASVRRRIVKLLRSLPVRDRTTILAQAIHEGTMTRVWADQVLIAIAFEGNRSHAQHCALSDGKRGADQRHP